MKKIKDAKKEKKGEQIKEKNASLDKTGSEKHERWNSKGKHSVEQKDNVGNKNERVKSMKKGDIEKKMNDDVF